MYASTFLRNNSELICLGTTYRPRSYHPTRGHPRKCYYIYCRLRRYPCYLQFALIYSLVIIPAGPHDRAHLESETRKAHVICVVYAIDNPNSFDRIPTYWLPHFRQLGVNVLLLLSLTCIHILTILLKVPVILVGNKIDLRGGEVTNEALEDEIVPIMNEFKVCSRVSPEIS